MISIIYILVNMANHHFQLSFFQLIDESWIVDAILEFFGGAFVGAAVLIVAGILTGEIDKLKSEKLSSTLDECTESLYATGFRDVEAGGGAAQSCLQ